MSGEEDFLKRWSRRKREVAEADKPKPPAAPADSAGAPAAQPEAASESGASVPEFDPKTLPPIESINALSDAAAFLRPGVPPDLTRAALRRVWTADPGIRDFVGLAENSWDFTDPTAMPGFGPLEATEEVRRMIADVVDQIGQAAKPAPVERASTGNPNDSNAATDDHSGQSPLPAVAEEDETKQSDADAIGTQVLLHSNKEDIAPRHDVPEASEKPKELSRKGHGRALPQ
jgi:hypothetical protein